MPDEQSVRTLEGRVVLVVGGRGGIGRRVVAALAASGATVIAASRQAADAHPAPHGVCWETVDIGRYADCMALMVRIIAAHGRLDAVVNCANPPAPSMSGKFTGVDPAGFVPFLEASLVTVFNLCHAALPVLARQGGAIVNFASDAGQHAAPNQTMIGATRAAIMMFSRALSLEASALGVRVNCVSTSYVKDTPVYEAAMSGPLASRVATAERRAGLGLPRAEDVASLAVFLCADDSAHLTGQIISVNGGVSA